MNSEPQCPVEGVLIDERHARVTAGFVAALTLSYLAYGHWLIPLFLAIDFLIRTSKAAKYSLLGAVARTIVEQWRTPARMVDRAPKRFAAGVGAFFASAIVLASCLNWSVAGLLLSGVLVIFAVLEAGFGFCAGCHVYSFLRKR